MYADPGKTLCCELRDDSCHMGYCTTANVGVSGKFSDKDDKLIFLQSPPLQNGWLVDIAAAA